MSLCVENLKCIAKTTIWAMEDIKQLITVQQMQNSCGSNLLNYSGSSKQPYRNAPHVLQHSDWLIYSGSSRQLSTMHSRGSSNLIGWNFSESADNQSQSKAPEATVWSADIYSGSSRQPITEHPPVWQESDWMKYSWNGVTGRMQVCLKVYKSSPV